MRVKDINEGPFQRGVATGFNATQKGGALAPDSLERTIKDYFTKPGKVEIVKGVGGEAVGSKATWGDWFKGPF